MTPTQRWTVVGVIVLIIGLLWLFWPKAEQKPAPVKGPVAVQPAAPKPEPAPAPRAAEPVSATALFDYDSAALRPGEAAKLDDLAAKAKGRSSDRVDVVGYADRIGSDSYNMGLSKRRAEAVRNHLVGKGIEAGRVRAEARGEGEAATGTACQNMGPESRSNRKLVDCLQRDRRVTVAVVAR
ncbi:MAG: OmpA family protein [Burkholderiales bacterium]